MREYNFCVEMDIPGGVVRRRGWFRGERRKVSTHRAVDAELQLPLGDCLLDPLAVGSVSGGFEAAFAAVNQAADLVGGTSGIFFSRAETVHSKSTIDSIRAH